MKEKMTKKNELDRHAEKLFQARTFANERESSDAVFLAGFRDKLEGAKSREAVKASNLLGAWSWKASPVAALISAMLIITLFSMGNNTETDISTFDELLWKSAAVESSEISQEQFLEVLFYGYSGR